MGHGVSGAVFGPCHLPHATHALTPAALCCRPCAAALSPTHPPTHQGEDLSAAYASSDVFVMPSESETLGFVVLEVRGAGGVRR